MKRREFVKASVAVSSLAGLASVAGCAGPEAKAEKTEGAMTGHGSAGREYYELRVYRLKAGASADLLSGYLEKAAIPAWNRMGCKPVGVFKQKDPTAPPAVFVLIPYPTIEVFQGAMARLASDKDYNAAAADYLSVAKANPAFERIDSWLMLAFAGMPKIELADYSKDKKPRMFELRTYESYGEEKALKKIDMFNDGEIQLMREVGLAPVFYGQALVGPNLPHLSYMTSAAGDNDKEHNEHWSKFGKSPVWDKMKNDPKYADTVSKISKWFLSPLPYSQI